MDVPVPWKFHLEPIMTQFSEDMDGLELEASASPERGFGTVAKHLKIQVRRDGETKVRLTSPVHVIDNLAETMGGDLEEQIREQKIDLEQIVLRVRQSGYRPQEVFSLAKGSKEVRVWLE